MRNRIMPLMGCLFCLCVISACSDDAPSPAPDITSFSGQMNGGNEVPSTASDATGAVTAEFDNKTKILVLTINYNNLSSDITVWHIHKGASGVGGSPVEGLDYGNMGASPFVWTSTPLDANMEADLMNNLYYVNIHTNNYPAGEIRGQLTKQ